MRKIYYIFNPTTRTYDRVYPNMAQRFLTILRRALMFIIFGGLSFLLFYLLIETPSMKDVQTENSRLLAQYNILSQRLDDAMDVLQDIQQRDDNMYRVMLNSEPVSKVARSAGYGGTNRYDELMDMDNAELVVQTTQKMDMLAKQMYIQIKSFDELVKMSREKEDYLRHLPAIQPISNRDLKRTASGYGRRIDPVYKVPKFHKGMDFSCDMRTPVYATADGKVVSAKWESGYGYTLEIDHGYGYRTRYAHLHSFTAKKGQHVVRGEQIALSGNSGKSTGPHLHYEVLVKGRPVNPINYYFMDLDADGYDEMLRMAENHGKVFD
ncbi:MAG: M23 family metallopeptidase [Bacteroidaceae bacterium]|nr:M23 family metallopeptidase [Bacteroidaceae bacterium]MBR7167039.1 M23 family metallopeptidase [Bacteroidaceae bacterium]